MSLRAEIIAIGTEVLMGDVINSNAAWLTNACLEAGIDVYYHSVVGDNPARIQGVVRQALARGANLIITTGGLGPTADDLTHETLAACFDTPQESDPESERWIAQFFANRGQALLTSNLKQALRPVGALTLPNPVGTAPGMVWPLPQQPTPAFLLTFPGVPRELKAMWPEAVRLLFELMGQQNNLQALPLHKQFVHFSGIGESALVQLLKEQGLGHWVDGQAQGEVTLAPYCSPGVVKLRLATRAASGPEAQARFNPVIQALSVAAPAYFTGTSPDGNHAEIEHVLGQYLLQVGAQLSVAESCTGGLVSHRLTNIAGSSAYTTLNVVTYSNAQKMQILDVPETMLNTHGAVSEPVALAMAQGILQRAGSQYGMGITGVAGPSGGSDEKPVGTVCIAVVAADGRAHSETFRGTPTLTRPEIKALFASHALLVAYRFIKGL